MKRKQPIGIIMTLLITPILSLTLFLYSVAADESSPGGLVPSGSNQRYTENIPIINVNDLGYQPITLPDDEPIIRSQFTIQHSHLNRGGGSDPANRYAVIRKTGPSFLAPGATAVYEVTLSNYEAITHTFQLTDTLPPQLTYLPDAAPDLSYDPTTRSLTWAGELAPGNLDYIIEHSNLSLPYLDLAEFGAVNLCDAFVTSGEPCRDATITFNLGINGYSTNLYGEPLRALTVSSNGLILGEATVGNGRNQWLPDGASPNFVIAGLWRDADGSEYGRWHAAILSGFIEGHDVFYAQWHDIPQVQNPSHTARHAIAILLDHDGNEYSPQEGHLFFIYDNISAPAQLVEQGYTIGIEDRLGQRGITFAYAPCCDDAQPAQGYPPAPGTTLQLRPILFGADKPYQRTFRYAATVTGQVPETVLNTAVFSSSSTNPTQAAGWASHYLALRYVTYLPMAQSERSQP